jgi:ribonucleoside-diphosphate reductase alpha chain
MNKEIYWLNKDSITFLERGYLTKNQTAEERIHEISKASEKILKKKGFAEKFESYMHKGWYSLSSPIWANFGNGRGLSISCNGSYIADTMNSILEKTAEVGMLTKYGAGTSGYFGDLRSRGTPISVGGASSGPVHFMEMFDSVTRVVSQSNVRRGSFAAYLPIEHPDIMEFLGIREEGHAIQDLSIGVCVGDKFMKKMIDGDKDARSIWAKIIKKRFESGYPYIFFTDNVNKEAPQVYKDNKMKIHASNLCSEICLSSSEDETFVCNLSSMNLLHYEDWKSTDAVETMTYFLDAVMEDYIQATENIPFLRAAHNFAKNQRALGIGVLGWHSFLQSKMITFESMEAKLLNTQIHRLIKEKSYAASKEMAKEYGEPPLLKGYGMRNVTTMAIAPTTSSSFILGQVSPSVEPLNSNYYTKDLAKGKFTYKNPYLENVLEKHGKNNADTWKSILMKGGSVAHLEFLSDHEKEVFQTFGEISQKEIIIQAAARQKYIDQGQSINLMIHPKTPAKEVNELMIFAWEQGIKCLYYQRGTNPSQELGRSILTCKACEA